MSLSEGMHESLDWAEDDARINLIDRTFCIYCTAFTSPVELENGYNDWNDLKLEELPLLTMIRRWHTNSVKSTNTLLNLRNFQVYYNKSTAESP